MRLHWVLPFVLAGAALAQGPGMRERKAPDFAELKSYLGLTDAQIEQMQKAREDSRTNLEAVHTQIQEKNQALRALLETAAPDPAAVGKLVIETSALRKKVQESHESVRQSVLNVLTGEQKTKLAGLQSAADLRPAIQQAMALGLLAPADGPGFGGMMGPMRRPGGPGMRAPGGGPMMRRGQGI